MDRTELRFRILFEYYKDLHEGKTDADNAEIRIRKYSISEQEIFAAEIWLVDSMFVKGDTQYDYHGLVNIFRISNIGINFVESVMEKSLTHIEDKFEDLKQLSKLEKIQKFSKECLNHPVTSEMCKMTYEAIVNFMNNG